jgi:hypothetical protein
LNRTIFILVLCILPVWAMGQLTQTGRWEIPVSNDEGELFQVAKADSLGLIVYSKILGKDKDQLEFIRLDTALQEVWRGYITIEKGLNIAITSTRKTSFYGILRNPRFAGFILIDLNMVTGAYTTHVVKNAIPFAPTDFAATNGAVMIGGYFNYRPLVLHYSLALQKAKILPGFFNEPGELTQMKVAEDGSIHVIVSAKNFERLKSLWIRNYSAEGDLIKTTVLESHEKRHLIFGRSIKMPNNEQVVAGVYGRNTEYSRGIFIATINLFGEYTIRYYNFADLQNFFKYLRANQEKRIKRRIERRRVKGKSTKFNYRLMVQELISYQNQFVLLGEAFYPHYTYRTKSTQFGINNLRGYSPYNTDFVFDGYQYTHAIVIGFDASGKVQWDNSFEINDVKSFKLEQFVKIAPSKDHIGLLYLFENLIRTKIIQGSEVLEGKSADEIKIFSDQGIVTKEDAKTSHLDYWYDHHFFASGVQTIRRSKERNDLPYKKVFFINKIHYR